MLACAVVAPLLTSAVTSCADPRTAEQRAASAARVACKSIGPEASCTRFTHTAVGGEVQLSPGGFNARSCSRQSHGRAAKHGICRVNSHHDFDREAIFLGALDASGRPGSGVLLASWKVVDFRGSFEHGLPACGALALSPWWQQLALWSNGTFVGSFAKGRANLGNRTWSSRLGGGVKLSLSAGNSTHLQGPWAPVLAATRHLTCRGSCKSFWLLVVSLQLLLVLPICAALLAVLKSSHPWIHNFRKCVLLPLFDVLTGTLVGIMNSFLPAGARAKGARAKVQALAGGALVKLVPWLAAHWLSMTEPVAHLISAWYTLEAANMIRDWAATAITTSSMMGEGGGSMMTWGKSFLRDVLTVHIESIRSGRETTTTKKGQWEAAGDLKRVGQLCKRFGFHEEEQVAVRLRFQRAISVLGRRIGELEPRGTT